MRCVLVVQRIIKWQALQVLSTTPPHPTSARVFATFDGSPRRTKCALGREVDADANGSWHARLPCDETAPLEHLHHLVDTRRGDKEVPLYVSLGGCSAKAMDVLGDKGEVFKLSLGGAQRCVLCCRPGCTLYVREESI